MPRRRPLQGLRCARFAESLLRRFAPRALRASSVPFLFAQQAGRWSAHLRLDARFALARAERRMERWIERRASRFSSVEKHDAVRVMNRFVTLTQGRQHAAASPAIALERVERLCTRIVERSVRREDAPASRSITSVASIAPGTAPFPRAGERAPAMIVTRGRAPEPKPGMAQVRERVSQAAGRALADAVREAPPAFGARPEPLEHVGVLADEVMRRIDRRIAAHRERFGRA